jgi:hypothetical protein
MNMVEDIFSQLATTANIGGRQIYIVVEGQSLATIAKTKYGDPRFARLIFTVNRGEIHLFQEGRQTFALIKPGQQILLPTNEEAKVFKRNFFTESTRTNFELSRYAHPASHASHANHSNSQSSTVVRRSLSANPAISEEQCQLLISLTNATRLTEANHQSNSNTNNTNITKPPTGFPPQKRLRTNQTKLQDCAAQEDVEITKLSSYCRVLKYASKNNSQESMFYLQIFNQTTWQTIATYLVQTNQAKRVKHFCDGSSQETNLKLPFNVAKELSENDFQRNWRNYTEVYFNHKEKISLERVIGTNVSYVWAV